MLEFNHVSKIYDGNIVAVNDVSFSVNEGEFVFLIGSSGSGKTTVIKMLIRDEKPSMGSVYFKEKDITKVNRSKVYKIRREIGVIFQDYKLIQDKTAFENVAFALEVAGKTNKEIQETVPYVLDIVGLANRGNAFPRQLSGGEQQRIAIARAISNNPKILIADEPTGNLDPSSAWDIVQILNKINNWGTTVIMSTHGTDIVNALNKRVIQMDSGKVIRDDSKGQYELASKNEFEQKMNDVSDEVIDKKEKKKIKISLETSLDKFTDDNLSESLLDTSAGKGSRGFFGFFKRKPKKEDSSNVLEEIFGGEIRNQEELHINGAEEVLKLKQKFESQTNIEDDDIPVVEDKSQDVVDSKEIVEEIKPKKQIKKKKTLKKARPLSMNITSNEEESITKNEQDEELEVQNSDLGSVDALNLSPEIIEELKNAGYNRVEDVVEDGIDTLKEKIDVSKKDLQKIAKAIKLSVDKNNV